MRCCPLKLVNLSLTLTFIMCNSVHEYSMVHLGSALVYWVLSNEAEKIGLVSCSFFSIKAKENFMTFCDKKTRIQGQLLGIRCSESNVLHWVFW